MLLCAQAVVYELLFHRNLIPIQLRLALVLLDVALDCGSLPVERPEAFVLRVPRRIGEIRREKGLTQDEIERIVM